MSSKKAQIAALQKEVTREKEEKKVSKKTRKQKNNVAASFFCDGKEGTNPIKPLPKPKSKVTVDISYRSRVSVAKQNSKVSVAKQSSKVSVTWYDVRKIYLDLLKMQDEVNGRIARKEYADEEDENDYSYEDTLFDLECKRDMVQDEIDRFLKRLQKDASPALQLFVKLPYFIET